VHFPSIAVNRRKIGNNRVAALARNIGNHLRKIIHMRKTISDEENFNRFGIQNIRQKKVATYCKY
jgi:hypothetical protein